MLIIYNANYIPSFFIYIQNDLLVISKFGFLIPYIYSLGDRYWYILLLLPLNNIIHNDTLLLPHIIYSHFDEIKTLASIICECINERFILFKSSSNTIVYGKLFLNNLIKFNSSDKIKKLICG